MKNLVCPISEERIPEHLPRISAFFTVVLLVADILSGFLPIVAFLAFDFLVRGFDNSRLSVINTLGIKTGKLLKIHGPMIDKAPKMFAARLGGFMMILLLPFHLFGLSFGSNLITMMVISLSTLELVFSFCVGCYLYSWLVLPVFGRK